MFESVKKRSFYVLFLECDRLVFCNPAHLAAFDARSGKPCEITPTGAPLQGIPGCSGRYSWLVVRGAMKRPAICWRVFGRQSGEFRSQMSYLAFRFRFPLFAGVCLAESSAPSCATMPAAFPVGCG